MAWEAWERPYVRQGGDGRVECVPRSLIDCNQKIERGAVPGLASHQRGEHPLRAIPSIGDADAAMAALHTQEKE
jgi:hypothetical protein